MKYKAKATYKDLEDSQNFKSLLSCSTHLKLKAGEVIEWKHDIPEGLQEHLIKIKDKKGDK
tara:strand:- start:125 stop:307 length:183 start_codon:yes stop_codon:yes gene_type:complete